VRATCPWDGQMGRKGLWLWCGVLLLLSFGSAVGCAQDIESPKFSLFAGAGTSSTSNQSVGSMQFGASFGETVPNQWKGLFLEGGYILPWSDPDSRSAFFSANYAASWQSKAAPRLLPFATVGYTRLFGKGNALNYGGGVDWLLQGKQALRLEVRDYQAFTTPQQHNVALRVGWIFYLYD